MLLSPSTGKSNLEKLDANASGILVRFGVAAFAAVEDNFADGMLGEDGTSCN